MSILAAIRREERKLEEQFGQATQSVGWRANRSKGARQINWSRDSWSEKARLVCGRAGEDRSRCQKALGKGASQSEKVGLRKISPGQRAGVAGPLITAYVHARLEVVGLNRGCLRPRSAGIAGIPRSKSLKKQKILSFSLRESRNTRR